MYELSLHGLEIESDYPLAGWPRTPGAPIDVRIVASGGPPVHREGACPIGGRTGSFPYSVYRDAHGFRFDVPDVAEFLTGARDVAVRVHEPHPPELIGLLVEGLVLAGVVIARGELALHASAVTTASGTTAFLANSGGGKSTLAALLCVDGGQLVADDVLRVVPGVGAARCHSGTARLRLRTNVRLLADLLRDWKRVETHDGRLGVAPPEPPPAELVLDRIVVPRFDAACSAPGLRRMRGAEAVTALLAIPRIAGWIDREVLQMLHARLSALVRCTPVYFATLPPLPLARGTGSWLDGLLRRSA